MSKALLWEDQDASPCPACGSARSRLDPAVRGAAPAVHGDEIDVTIAHGVCNPDGTPRRYRSRRELRDTEIATGWRRLERGEKFKGQESRIANDNW